MYLSGQKRARTRAKTGAALAIAPSPSLNLALPSLHFSQPADAAAGLAAALRPAGAALASFAKDSGLGAEVAKALPAAAAAAGGLPSPGGLPGGGFQALKSQPSAAHEAADAAAAPIFNGEQSILATVPGGGHSVFGHMGSAPGTPFVAAGSAPLGYEPAPYAPSAVGETTDDSAGKMVGDDRLAAKELVPGAAAFPGSGVSKWTEERGGALPSLNLLPLSPLIHLSLSFNSPPRASRSTRPTTRGRGPRMSGAAGSSRWAGTRAALRRWGSPARRGRG